MTTQTTSQTILIVEDEEPIVRLLTRLLTAQGFQIDVADDGEAALQSVGDHPPSLVLLDVGLPGMNGIEVCRRLKSSPATCLTPVVMLTGLQGREYRLAGINARGRRFPVEAVRLRGTARADSIAGSHEALYRRARIDRVDHCQPGPHGGSPGRLHRRPLRASGAYATALGAELGFTASDLDTLRRGGYLHTSARLGFPTRCC